MASRGTLHSTVAVSLVYRRLVHGQWHSTEDVSTVTVSKCKSPRLTQTGAGTAGVQGANDRLTELENIINFKKNILKKCLNLIGKFI